MLLANESMIMLVIFIGIAAIIVGAINANYDDTIKSIDKIGESKTAQISESVIILDVNRSEGKTYAILSNRAEHALVLTEFWDHDGTDITCDIGKSMNPDSITIPADGIVTLSCNVGSGDIVMMSENYSLIRIRT